MNRREILGGGLFLAGQSIAGALSANAFAEYISTFKYMDAIKEAEALKLKQEVELIQMHPSETAQIQGAQNNIDKLNSQISSLTTRLDESNSKVLNNVVDATSAGGVLTLAGVGVLFNPFVDNSTSVQAPPEQKIF